MAEKHTTTIQVRAASGHKAKIVLPGCQTLAAGKAFLTSVETAYMEGVGVSVAHSNAEFIPDKVISGGNTDRRAVISYMDVTNNRVKRISIPSWGTDPGDSSLEQAGERVPLVACQSVVEALQTATGGNLVALDGYIIQGR